VLEGLDSMPWSLLLWRSISQWLGGMGVVILGVAILPLLGVGGMQVYKDEAPGPTQDKMTPRIAETAMLLWVPYLGLSLLAGVLYVASGMTVFDAVCHAMTTVSTGGFSTHDASLGFYDSSLIHLIAVVFMIAGGTSFVILHRALTGGLSWSNQPELRAYIGIIGLASALIAFDLVNRMSADFVSTAEVLEHALFQAVSIVSSTGYSTRDYGLWPSLSQTTLLMLFFVGGMAGSTAGGVKVVRIVLLLRLAFAQFFRLLHPKGVRIVRLGSRTVDDEILVSSVGFIGMWLLLIGLGAGLVSLYGTDFTSSVAVAAATLGNIGPGLGTAGPASSYAPFDDGAKLVLSALMILGRLEIFTVLIILTPGFWRR
jgi:trk system potassium uptake protein TrkH